MSNQNHGRPSHSFGPLAHGGRSVDEGLDRGLWAGLRNHLMEPLGNTLACERRRENRPAFAVSKRSESRKEYRLFLTERERQNALSPIPLDHWGTSLRWGTDKKDLAKDALSW
ncbi:hypothetical protein LTR27_003908 [Elasticomyces elasticus]|nr:hypothetical protein LTR27_003908 [Elasticomyces elasticus]